MKDKDVATQMIDMMKRLDSMTYNHSVWRVYALMNDSQRQAAVLYE